MNKTIFEQPLNLFINKIKIKQKIKFQFTYGKAEIKTELNNLLKQHGYSLTKIKTIQLPKFEKLSFKFTALGIQGVVKSPLLLCSVPLPMTISVSSPFWYLSLNVITFHSSLLKDIPASAKLYVTDAYANIPQTRFSLPLSPQPNALDSPLFISFLTSSLFCFPLSFLSAYLFSIHLLI